MTYSKKSEVLKYLKTHKRAGLTSKEAFGLFECTRLAVAIHSLRKDGWDIITHMIKPEKGNKYAKYVLKGRTKE